MSPPHRMTASPNPAKVGDTVTVLYDMDGLSPPPPSEVCVSGDPESIGFYYCVPIGEPPDDQFSFVVPAGCQGITVVDPSGLSADCTITVVP